LDTPINRTTTKNILKKPNSSSETIEITKFDYRPIDFDYIGLEFSLDTSALIEIPSGTYGIVVEFLDGKEEGKETDLLGEHDLVILNTDLNGNSYAFTPSIKL
jgi:hypothetical protein